MDWRAYIKGLDLTDTTSNFGFNMPTSDNLLEELKTQFGLIELPRELEALYR